MKVYVITDNENAIWGIYTSEHGAMCAVDALEAKDPTIFRQGSLFVDEYIVKE